jgi:simple sugar transport system substrate-binding protein
MGTQGSSAELDRNDGLHEILDPCKNITCTNSGYCDFTYASGKLEMERYLKRYGSRFTVVYAQNDDMAIGAIDAIKEYGLKPGKDIIVFGTDGTKQALLAVKRGEMYNTVECNPLLGPQLMLAVRKVSQGETVPLRIINSENLFSRDISYWTIFKREY